MKTWNYCEDCEQIGEEGKGISATAHCDHEFQTKGVPTMNTRIRPVALTVFVVAAVLMGLGCPGPIATEHPDNPGMAHHIQSMVGRVPLGRLGTPAEIAALCGFLTSNEGGFVSGQMIACNGAAQT